MQRVLLQILGLAVVVVVGRFLVTFMHHLQAQVVRV